MKPSFVSYADPGAFVLADDATHFMCGPCDKVLPISEFSHVCNLMGLLCCKSCNEAMKEA